MKQTDCFNTQLTFFKWFGLYCPKVNRFKHYESYQKVFAFLFIILYGFLFSINFIFIERQMDLIVEEMILWLTIVNVASKEITFLIFHDDIRKMLELLESDTFRPTTEAGRMIVDKAKKTNVLMWKMFAAVSLTSNLSHAGTPVILHLILGLRLDLPVCSYAFLTPPFIQRFIYPLYLYQFLGIHVNMWCNVNIDSFFLGVLNLTRAQIDILDYNLRRVTDVPNSRRLGENLEEEIYLKLRKNVLHYSSIIEFCQLVQDIFSVTLFVQINIAAYIICVCLYRLTLPLTPEYLVFLTMYITVMVLQILIPCWFGHQIYDKSSQLPAAVYTCDWPGQGRRFASSLRLLVARAGGRPLAIVGGKMFPLLLTAFTSIAHTAYSFFALLRKVQAEK